MYLQIISLGFLETDAFMVENKELEEAINYFLITKNEISHFLIL